MPSVNKYVVSVCFSVPACFLVYLLIAVPTQIKSYCNLLATDLLGVFGSFQLLVRLEMSPRHGILW